MFVLLDEVHGLLHVVQELVSPQHFATDGRQVVANGRVITLLMIQLQVQTIQSESVTREGGFLNTYFQGLVNIR